MSEHIFSKAHVKALLSRPALEVFIDGRNEHGSHVLTMNFENRLCVEDVDGIISDLEDQSSGLAEQIIKDAEILGHKTHHCIVTLWKHDSDGECGRWCNYEGIDPVLTELVCGTPQEQEAEFKRAESASQITNCPC